MSERYCPECGSIDITEIKGIHFDGSHVHCDKCNQEFFTDVDYSRAIGFNLRKMKEEIERQRALIEKLESDLACSEASQNTLRSANRLMQDLIKNAEYIFTLQLGYFRNENENHKDREYIDYLLGLGRYFNSNE